MKARHVTHAQRSAIITMAENASTAEEIGQFLGMSADDISAICTMIGVPLESISSDVPMEDILFGGVVPHPSAHGSVIDAQLRKLCEAAKSRPVDTPPGGGTSTPTVKIPSLESVRLEQMRARKFMRFERNDTPWS